MLNQDVPLHYQIYQQIRSEIDDGLWVGRPDFPGEEELAQRFSVSVITSRKALSRLSDEGWIERQRGRRSQVLRGAKIPLTHSAPVVFPLHLAHPYTYKRLSHGVGIAAAEACEAFGKPAGSLLWQCSRLRRFKGKLHSVTYNAQRQEVGKRHALAELESKPMAQILEKEGLAIAQVTRRLSATPAGVDVASALGISVQQPTLVHTFTMRDSQGSVIEWVRIHLHPDQQSHTEVLALDDGCWRPTHAP